MKIQTKIDPVPLREKSYPSVGDQLDLIVKTFEHLQNQGIDIGEHGNQLVAESKSVKEKYPKK